MKTNSDFTIALKWITDILNRFNISYQVVGGLAAKLYGSSRPLHDIDFYVPSKEFSILEEELTEYIKFGLEHHQDENWDLFFMVIIYEGQQIEFGDSDSAKYFDSHSHQWINQEINFAESNIITFEGIALPVMPKKDLIEYKHRLDRYVDRVDIDEMQNYT